MHTPQAPQRGLIDTGILATACLMVALLLITFYAGVFYEGRRLAEDATQQLAQQQIRHDQLVRQLGQERGAAESDLKQQIAALRSQLDTPQGEANAQHETLVADLRAGTVSVRVPIVPTSCTPERGHAPSESTAGSQKAYAELDPAAAADLAAIPHEGDAAIRDLNYCIDRYQLLESTWQQWRSKLLQVEADNAQAS